MANASHEPLFCRMQEVNKMDFVVCGKFTKLLSCSVAGGLSSQLAMDGYEGPSLIFSVLTVAGGERHELSYCEIFKELPEP